MQLKNTPKLIFLFALSAFALISCTDFSGKSEIKKNTGEETKDIPSMEFPTGFTRIKYEGTNKIWEMTSSSAEFYEKNKTAKLEKVLLKTFSGKKVTAKVTADNGKVYTGQDKIILHNVKIHSLDGDKITARAEANVAVLKPSIKDITLISNVVIYSSNNTKLTTEKLMWDHKNKKIHTEDKIFILHPDGHWVRGTGMIADLNLDSITIFNETDNGNVTAL